MKNLLFLKQCLSIAVLCLGILAQGGPSDGAGGEHITHENNPWFIGDEPILYCIELDEENFSLSKTEADLAIREAFRDWADTLKEFKTEPTHSGFVHRERKNLSLNLKLESECTQNTELRFLLGSHNTAIKKELKNHVPFTIAFSKKTSFSDQTGRAKGYIWVVPDKGEHVYQGPKSKTQGFWSMSSSLKTLLIHELGHVYGIGHLEYGVMNSQVPQSILSGWVGFTSKNYQFFNWYLLGRKVCGGLNTDSDMLPWLGLDVTNKNYQICISPTSANGEQIEVSISDLGTIKKTLIIKKIGDAFGMIHFFLAGNYRYNDPKLSTYMGHRFVSLAPDQLVGHYDLNGKKILVNIQSILGYGTRVQTIMADGSKAAWFEARLPRHSPYRK